MIRDILAWGGMPGGWEWIVILVVFGIPVLLIILFARLLLRNKRENVRLRLEVGKLADELEQMRKKAGGAEKGNSSDKSN
jgi:uncharacterized membrane-anchored protein YhcB (DUF1043 family)